MAGSGDFRPPSRSSDLGAYDLASFGTASGLSLLFREQCGSLCHVPLAAHLADSLGRISLIGLVIAQIVIPSIGKLEGIALRVEPCLLPFCGLLALLQGCID